MIAGGAFPVLAPHRGDPAAGPQPDHRQRHRINGGLLPDLDRPEGESDFYFVPAEDPETAVEKVVELVSVRMPRALRPRPDP